MRPVEFSDLLEQMQQAGQRLQAARQQLQARRLQASVGGGMVKAEADGSGRLLKLTFAAELLAQPDPQMLEDLVVAAVNQLQEKARQAAAEALGELCAGLDPGLFGNLLP